MKTYYVKDLEKNLLLQNETFAIFEFETPEDKNGKKYYKLLLGDKTGKIQAKVWSDKVGNVEKNALKVGAVVSISGKVEEYQGKIQLNIMELRSVDETALESFIESSEFNSENMFGELLGEIENIKNKGIREVLLNIFSNTEITQKFKYWVAAKTIHHDFRSGLLQHVLEMISISKGLKRFYPMLNFDILTAGIILHDIGKTEELDSAGISISYTKKGTLIGHIVMGVMIFEKFGGKELPQDIYLHISHLILSHHGSHEFGSPVVPATPEAIALSYLDQISSKTRAAVKAVGEITADKEFSQYNQWLENARLWNGGDSRLDYIDPVNEETDIKEEGNNKLEESQSVENQVTKDNIKEGDLEQLTLV